MVIERQLTGNLKHNHIQPVLHCLVLNLDLVCRSHVHEGLEFLLKFVAYYFLHQRSKYLWDESENKSFQLIFFLNKLYPKWYPLPFWCRLKTCVVCLFKRIYLRNLHQVLALASACAYNMDNGATLICFFYRNSSRNKI